jgi:hypothetical protein
MEAAFIGHIRCFGKSGCLCVGLEYDIHIRNYDQLPMEHYFGEGTYYTSKSIYHPEPRQRERLKHKPFHVVARRVETR